MRTVKVILFVASLSTIALCVETFGNAQYGFNPALNPVRLKKAPSHSPLELVKNGKPQFAIAFDHTIEKKIHNRRASIHQSVKVLKDAFKKCFGFDVPVVDTNTAGIGKKYKYLILVGKSVLTDKLGLKPLALPKEGFEVRTFDGGVAIAGHDGSLIPDAYNKMDWSRYKINGTLNGAYDFIERFLGVRFYFPGNGVIWPKKTDLTIQPVRYIDWPEFKMRYTHALQNSLSKKKWMAELGEYHPVNFESRWRLGFGTRFVATHSPTPRTWVKAHPDKLDLIFYRAPNGHLYHTKKTHVGNYFDVTNLAVADLLIEDLKKFYKTDGKWKVTWGGWYPPNSDYILFGQCDTYMASLSNKTVRDLKLIPPSRKNSRAGALSDIYARFSIDLANKIKKELPGKRLAIMPYHNYALPPLKPEYRKFPDNIDIRLCVGDFPRRVKDDKIIKKWRKAFADWYEVLGERPVAGLWLYNAPNDPFGRAVIPRFVGEIPKKMGKYLGREGLYFDLYGPFDWEYYYAYYVMYRSMWNPDFDVNAALDEHWKLLYGKAAPFIKEFDSILVDRWVKVRAKGGPPEKAYPLKTLGDLEALLKKAEKSLSKDSVEMRRFKLFSKPWAKAIKRKRGVVLFKKPLYLVKWVPKDNEMRIDGKLDEKIWNSAPKLNMLDPFGSGEAPKNSMSGSLIWNKKGIYGAFAMKGKPLADKNKSIFANDNIEFFLSPGMERNNFFQLVVDTINQTWNGKQTLKPVATPYNKHWVCEGFKSAVSINENGWNLEFFVPFAGLEIESPKVYSSWLANLVRNKNSNPREYSSFSLTQGRNNNVKNFGIIKFCGKGD